MERPVIGAGTVDTSPPAQRVGRLILLLISQLIRLVLVSKIAIDSLSAGKINRVPPTTTPACNSPATSSDKTAKIKSAKSVPRISHNEVQMSRWHSLYPTAHHY